MLRHGGGHGPSGGTNLSVRFYMYTDRALDHGWFDGCPSFQALRSSSNNDNLAEVGLRRSLLSSPLRVHSPQEARLFYVPVFEFASFAMGECANTTHPQRMAAAHAALQASLSILEAPQRERSFLRL
ncbi:hypothetical protein AB1Y20_021945 [Prymnesium parvum]|uniref:Uncharacterized protein n=1 Tax=Prymnesium parvum TaxID=97485 RepID=A0AB34JFE9_PRYPA